MAKARKSMKGPGDGLTEKKLLNGWTTATSGVRVRLATAADLAAMERLVPATGVDLAQEMIDAISDGLMGSTRRAALAGRGQEHGHPAFIRAMAEAFTSGGVETAYLAASLALVAEHRESGVVGTVVAYSPPNVAD